MNGTLTKTSPFLISLAAAATLILPGHGATVVSPGETGGGSLNDGTNLVFNSGAEIDTPTRNGANIQISGWETGQTSGNSQASAVNTAATAQAYNLFAAARPSAYSGFTSYGRSYFYAGGADWSVNNGIGDAINDRVSPQVALSQSIDISRVAARSEFELSAWFGGMGSNDSSAFVDAMFFDAAGSHLETYRVGGVRAADRGNDSALWVQRAEIGEIPQGASRVTVSVWYDSPMSLAGCSCITTGEGAVDNISLTVPMSLVIPEPVTTGSILAGAASLAFRRRRRSE